MNRRRLDRRGFLAAASAVCGAGLAGCTDDGESDGESGEDASGDPSPSTSGSSAAAGDGSTATGGEIDAGTGTAREDSTRAVAAPTAVGDPTYESPPERTWDRSYDDTGEAAAVALLGDGYALAGRAETGGFVAGVDASGEEQWRTGFGTAAVEFATDAMAADDDVAVTGPSETADEAQEFRLATFDVDGSEQWSRTYGTGVAETPRALARSRDGGYLLVGFHQPPDATGIGTRVVKTDADGRLAWDHVFADRRYANPGIAQLSGGDVVVAGNAGAMLGGPEIRVARLSSDGRVRAERTIERDGDVLVGTVAATADGYLVAGSQDGAALLVAFDAADEVGWELTFGDDLGQIGAEDLARLPGGGFLVAGGTATFGADAPKEAWFAEVSPQGGLFWQAASDAAVGDERPRLTAVSLTDDAVVAAGAVGSGEFSGTDAYLAAFG